MDQTSKPALEQDSTGKIHAHLKIDGEIPAPDSEKMRECQFVLIRHATTDFNVVYEKYMLENKFQTEEYRLFKADPSYIDPPINGIGRDQAYSQ